MQLFTEYEYAICNNANPDAGWQRITRDAAAQVAGVKQLWILEGEVDAQNGGTLIIEQHGKGWHTSHTLVVTAKDQVKGGS